MPNPFPLELRWLYQKIRPHLPLHFASFLCLTLASLMVLITPLCMRWLIDSILPAGDSRLLVVAVGLIFMSHEGRAVFDALSGYLTFRAAQRTALDLRMSLLRHLGSLSAEYHDRTPVGEMLYPFSGPIDEISYFGSDLLPSIFRTIVATGTSLAAMIFLSPFLSFIVTPLIPAFLSIRDHYRSRIGHEADAVQTDQAKFSSFLQEHLSALTQIQLLRQTEAQERKAHQLLTNSVCSQDVLCRTGVFFSAFSNLTIVTGLAAILCSGSLMVLSGKLTIGTLVAFYALVTQLFDSLSSVTEMYSRAQRTFSSIRQVRAVIEVAPAIKEHPHARPLQLRSPLNVEFREVSFGYGGRRTIIDIPRLEILQGERVAIVGPNGSGKSTLVKLLARIYDVDSGAILIAGSDVRAVELTSLRSSICYLSTQPILFHRSIADNLRFGRFESTCGDLERVLRIVGLTRYLDGYPGSLGEYIEPSASNLSNGERQRVAIARALLQRPRVLIFDETTSSLDPSSEETILRTIDRTLPDSTLIVVSHRVHSVSWIGRILLMRKGQVVGDDNHSVLSATNSLYTQFILSRAFVD